MPLVSVNAPKLDVEVLRIGDRGLLPTLRSEDFLGQLSGATARTIAAEKGLRVWKGTLDTAKAELNQEAVTAFPVLQAVGKLEPGLYVMLARPSGTAASDEDATRRQATQWFVVSDLGLTATKGRDGVHVVLRSLASAQVMPGAEIRLIARNNEVLGTRTTDAQGHVAFDPGLARGEGGTAPSLVVAQAGGDYGFLDLNLGAFDLTDRGVKGRPETGGLDAYLFPERGVYRTGETVQLTALLRDPRGAAVPDLPLTLVVKRPDGVEYRRVSVPDQGLGGRALPLPLLSGAMHGTWRVSAYTDPKAPALGEASFLVEDYVPERLEVTLKARQDGSAPGRGRAGRCRRALPLRRPRRRARRVGQRHRAGRRYQRHPGPGGLCHRPRRRGGGAGHAGDPGPRDHECRRAPPLVTVPVPQVAAPRALEAKITLAVGEPGGRALSRSLTLPILPANPVLALRKGFTDLKEGGLATFDVVLATPDGALLRPAGGGLDPVAGRPALPMVPGGRALVVRGGQDRPARGQRHRRPQGRRPGPDRGAGGTRPLPAGGLGPGRARGDREPRLRGGLGRLGDRGGAGPPRPHPRQGRLRGRRHAAGQAQPEIQGSGQPDGGQRPRARDPGGQRAGGRHHREPAGEGRVGRGRLSGGHRLPAPRPGGQAPARPGAGSGVVLGGPGAAQPRRRPEGAGAGAPAPGPDPAGPAHGAEIRRAGADHRGAGRCRHPQPDPLRGAGPDAILPRPEGPGAGGPRPLRLPDRRHAGLGRGDPLRRRRGRRRARRSRRRPRRRWRSIPGSSPWDRTARPASPSRSRPSTAPAA